MPRKLILHKSRAMSLIKAHAREIDVKLIDIISTHRAETGASLREAIADLARAARRIKRLDPLGRLDWPSLANVEKFYGSGWGQR